MTTRKAFQFKKTYEEVEIAGETYQVDFSDESVNRYNKSFIEFYEETKRINAVDVSKLSVEKQSEMFGEMQELVKGVVNELLGRGSYETLYDASGKSLMNMIEMIEYLSEVVGDKTQKIREGRKKKYLVNKQKK